MEKLWAIAQMSEFLTIDRECLYHNSVHFSDWQAVVIYPSRSTEQSKVYAHRSMLNGEQVHRIYLDELGDVQSLPVPVAVAGLQQFGGSGTVVRGARITQ
jgi:Protein of unknown function (DUF2887)